MTIHWTTPVTDDFRKSNVYRNTTNSSIGATLMTTIVGVQNTPYSTTDVPGGTRYYFVSAQDASGNESALTYAGSGS
jgi:gamma-glutamyltranspeptidase